MISARKRQAGFTLFEMAISLGIIITLLGILTQANRATNKLSDTTMTLGRLDEAASQATLLMATELRWAQPGTMLITPENGSDRIDFLMAEGYDGTNTLWSTPITFRIEPLAMDTNENGVADEGRLVRIQDGATRVLCRNVALGGLSLVRTNEIVDIQLTIFKLTADDEALNRTVALSATLVNGA